MRNAFLRVGIVLGAVVSTVAFALTGASYASSVYDPTGGAANDVLNQAKDWLTTYGVPLAIGLLVVGIIVVLLIKMAKRGTRAA